MLFCNRERLLYKVSNRSCSAAGMLSVSGMCRISTDGSFSGKCVIIQITEWILRSIGFHIRSRTDHSYNEQYFGRGAYGADLI